MKFNEKLIELRKKEGLSQEELGYKLNVTRQTVSKWELGQTTPEMEKLVEISKIFNISVDELVNESQEAVNQNPIIEDQPIIGEKTSKNNKTVIFIVGALIVVVILIVVKLFSGINTFNKVKDEVGDVQTGILERFFGIFDRALDITEKNMDSMDEKGDMFNQVKDIFNETENNITKSQFNGVLEIYSGSNMGNGVESLLDSIITNNKKQDRKITVKYMQTETQSEEEIKGIKRNIGTFNNYEITYEYDADGFINKAIVEKI